MNDAERIAELVNDLRFVATVFNTTDDFPNLVDLLLASAETIEKIMTKINGGNL